MPSWWSSIKISDLLGTTYNNMRFSVRYTKGFDNATTAVVEYLVTQKNDNILIGKRMDRPDTCLSNVYTLIKPLVERETESETGYQTSESRIWKCDDDVSMSIFLHSLYRQTCVVQLVPASEAAVGQSMRKNEVCTLHFIELQMMGMHASVVNEIVIHTPNMSVTLLTGECCNLGIAKWKYR